jgi:type 1 glutamine amidotransferase/sugar phosphate isomerase/epimerase
MTRRDFLGSVAASAGMLAVPRLGFAAAQTQVVLEPGEQQQIEAAIPTKSFVGPRRHRKLLIFDLNVGYGGHRSITTANLAFTLMGAKTGSFETVVSKDPSVFKAENLRRFDAVFLNNTVGNLFEDAGLRQSLVEFVYGGGGLLGVHGTSVAFTRWPGADEDWPEFGIMLGARGANHRDSDEHVFIKLDDLSHPLNQPFGGKGFEYRDEFFRVHGPYSRHRVRVLLSIDTEKTDINQGPARGDCFREDNDYALAWVRQYGRGRVFYCTIAHNPYVFWDPKILQFYLAAAQFALGDLPAPTTPSGKLTPAIRAQEQLGWRLGLTPPTFQITSGNFNLFEAIDKTAELGLLYIGGWNLQTVSRDIPNNFDGQLSNDELKQIRLKLDAVGVRLLTYHIHSMPSDEAGCRKVFEFGRKMGIETFIAEPPPDVLDTVESLCDEYDISLAIPNRDQKSSPHYGRPQEVLKVCHGRSKRVGACGNIASWMRSGIDPAEAIRMLRDRLITLQVHDLDELTSKGHEAQWGTGAGKIGPLLEEIHRLGLKPIMFSVEYPHEGSGLMPGIAQSIEFFNKISVQLAKRGEL